MTPRNLKKVQREAVTPLWMIHQFDAVEREMQQRRIQAVQNAVAKLSPLERDIIIRVHFDGATLRQFADDSGYSLQHILNLHRRALRRLHKLLSGFVSGEFNITTTNSSCVICNSPNRTEIDELLQQRRPGAPYRDIMRQIRSSFGVAIASTMTIIGHIKYHN